MDSSDVAPVAVITCASSGIGAATAPRGVCINEILVRPTAQAG